MGLLGGLTVVVMSERKGLTLTLTLTLMLTL